MYSIVYNRLLGWTFAVLAMMGWWFHSIGDYIALTHTENLVNSGFAVVFLFFARQRMRYASATALALGLLFLAWAICGMAGIPLPTGTADPLENALRFVAGSWGVYVALHDVAAWRLEDIPS